MRLGKNDGTIQIFADTNWGVKPQKQHHDGKTRPGSHMACSGGPAATGWIGPIGSLRGLPGCCCRCRWVRGPYYFLLWLRCAVLAKSGRCGFCCRRLLCVWFFWPGSPNCTPLALRLAPPPFLSRDAFGVCATMSACCCKFSFWPFPLCFLLAFWGSRLLDAFSF